MLCCEAEQGVSGIRHSTAASNRGGGPCYMQWRPREIPVQAMLWIEVECSGKPLGTRRSCGATRGRLRCGGEASPRWRRTTVRRGYAEAVELGFKSGGYGVRLPGSVGWGV